jgi:hypothetical protein
MPSSIVEHLPFTPSSPSITSVSSGVTSTVSFADLSLSPGLTSLPHEMTTAESSNVKEHGVYFWRDGMTTIRVRYDIVIFSRL